MFVAEKWFDKVVEVSRVNDRMMVVRMIVGERLVSIITAYAPQSGRQDEEKEEFWDGLLKVTTGIAQGQLCWEVT